MRNRRTLAGLAIAGAAVIALAWQGQAQPAANDDAAIRKSATAYADAFNKGDPKAIAAMWTEQGECRTPDGSTFVGREAIEKAHAEVFKATPGAKIELLVKSVRFPAKDLAVEEGLVRQVLAKGMPRTTSYVTVHVREGGQWKIALSSEAGAGLDRLEDLDWLFGEWNGKTKDGAGMKFAFAKDAKKPTVTGTFTRTVTGKEPAIGTLRIQFDPELGRLRSWAFEDDGAHSQGLWTNDGKSWLIEIRGTLASGTPFSETIVLQRVAADAITWHATDRILDGQPLADTPPLRLTISK